jgi:hypothetical protein
MINGFRNHHARRSKLINLYPLFQCGSSIQVSGNAGGRHFDSQPLPEARFAGMTAPHIPPSAAVFKNASPSLPRSLLRFKLVRIFDPLTCAFSGTLNFFVRHDRLAPP